MCMCAHTSQNVGSPRAGNTGHCGPLDLGAGIKLSPVEEHYFLLTPCAFCLSNPLFCLFILAFYLFGSR